MGESVDPSAAPKRRGRPRGSAITKKKGEVKPKLTSNIELEVLVANQCGMPPKDVRDIMETMRDVVAKLLITEQKVSLKKFVTFRVPSQTEAATAQRKRKVPYPKVFVKAAPEFTASVQAAEF